jgi:zinc transport system permease protein
MTPALLFDPLFLVPFLNGLVLAAILPALGTYARLRGEWLASLAIGQAAAAGVVLGAFLGVPVVATATATAIVAALGKTAFGRGDGEDTYAVILLAGWSVALLLAANTAHGDDLSRALLQGQIYFTGASHLAAIAAVGGAVTVGLPAISRRLLLARFFPEYYPANGVTNPRHDVVFDVLMALTLATAASVVGVMAALALVFVPSWIAFARAHGWRRTVTWAAALGVAAHVAAFALAIAFDQPYGPMLVAVLLASSAARAVRA